MEVSFLPMLLTLGGISITLNMFLALGLKILTILIISFHPDEVNNLQAKGRFILTLVGWVGILAFPIVLSEAISVSSDLIHLTETLLTIFFVAFSAAGLSNSLGLKLFLVENEAYAKRRKERKKKAKDPNES